MQIRFVEGRSAGIGLPLNLTSLRNADHKTLLDSGFRTLVKQGLAQELTEVDNQHFIAWSGRSIVSPIELLFGSFPSEGFQPYTTLDTFSDNALWALRTALISLSLAVSQVEANEGQSKTPSDVIFCQHIGPEESDVGTYPLQTFSQFHLHVFSNSSSGVKFINYPKLTRNIFQEPLASVMADIVARSGLNITFESETASLVIADHFPDLSVNHLRLLAKCTVYWKRIWDELASCFTRFETDEQGRFIPEIDSKQLDSFFEKYRLSPQSKRKLLFLKKHLQKTSDQDMPWSWFVKGVFGSLTLVHHVEDDTWSIRLIPRTRVSNPRTLVISKDHIQAFDKNRFKNYTPDEDQRYIENQIAAMRTFREYFKKVTPLAILMTVMSGPEPIVEKYQGRQ